MARIGSLGGVMFAVMVLLGCGDDAAEDGMDLSAGAGGTGAGADAGGGVDHLADDPTAIDPASYLAALEGLDYESFARAPGYDTPQPASGPHGEMVIVYVNAPLEAALSMSGLSAWPDGSLVVKEATDAAGTLETTSVMEKYDDAWYFAEYSASGTFIAGGLDATSCTGCHAGTEDGVLSFTLP